MARRTRQEAEKTRSRIMASALSLFVRNGYEHTTFTQIAERLKLTKGAVYWHFENKERLLVALVDEMLMKFRRQLDSLMPKENLTFPVVAEMMEANAELILHDAKGVAFFMLMMTQVRWGAASMTKVREALLSRDSSGPYQAFRHAVENDRASGRARADVDADSIASVAMAIWDGLVRAHIERMTTVDIREALKMAYTALWNSMRNDIQATGFETGEERVK